MKAMVYHQYGSPDVLELQEIERPLVKEDEALVKIHAASLNWLDWHFLTGKPLLARFMAGLFKPKYQVLGIDLAGVVEALGANVTQFQPGDEVFGSGSHGCFAEYASIPATNLVIKPVHLTFEEAASILGAAVTALHALHGPSGIKPGQMVLINGASGGVGTFAVQIAKALGAQVTGVCSTKNLDMVREIGADKVIDYTQEDFAQNRERYDLIFDAVAKRAFSDCKRVLKAQGKYMTTEFSPTLALKGLLSSTIGNQEMVPLPPKPPSEDDQKIIKEFLESGKINPVIDRSYSLSEVPKALRYLGEGHARGKVIITI